MIDIEGVMVTEKIEEYGVRYSFTDGDNEIFLDLTELTIEEFLEFSADIRDFTEYSIMKPYEVKTITGYDWEIKRGKDRPNIRRIFRTIEMIGKRYTGINYPNIMYYVYEDARMHKHYRDWIEFMGYKLIHDDKIAMYYKESKK